MNDVLLFPFKGRRGGGGDKEEGPPFSQPRSAWQVLLKVLDVGYCVIDTRKRHTESRWATIRSPSSRMTHTRVCVLHVFHP